LLAWLFVQVRPTNTKAYLDLAIGSLLPDGEMPLYEVLQKPKRMKGAHHVAMHLIRPEEEPALREFFTQVAQSCGRPVVP
jgi:hypothetical protein